MSDEVRGAKLGQRRWSEHAKDLVEDLTGVRGTTCIAALVGRSVKAVRHVMSKRGVSPLDGDGRYTAAELARILGISKQTVANYCRRGWIPAEQLGSGRGAIWRIDWDGVSPILPSWSCRVCGRPAADPRVRWCSSRCKYLGADRPRRQRQSLTSDRQRADG